LAAAAGIGRFSNNLDDFTPRAGASRHIDKLIEVNSRYQDWRLLMTCIAAFLLAAFLLVFLATPVMAAKVSYCAQAHDSAAARLKWARERQRDGETLQKYDSCHAYRSDFYEAAVTRQNITRCEQDDIRQSALEVIDAEINAFNDLIATYCSE
jgi:hypothetical protein